MIKEINPGDEFYFCSGPSVWKAICKATEKHEWGMWIYTTNNGGLKASIAYHTRDEAEGAARRYQMGWRGMLRREYLHAKKAYKDYVKEMENPIVFHDVE